MVGATLRIQEAERGALRDRGGNVVRVRVRIRAATGDGGPPTGVVLVMEELNPTRPS